MVDGEIHERLWQVTCVLEIKNVNFTLLIDHEVVQVEVGEGEDDVLVIEVNFWQLEPVSIASFSEDLLQHNYNQSAQISLLDVPS